MDYSKRLRGLSGFCNLLLLFLCFCFKASCRIDELADSLDCQNYLSLLIEIEYYYPLDWLDLNPLRGMDLLFNPHLDRLEYCKVFIQDYQYNLQLSILAFLQ